ncbi:MAG: hypothetical protein ACXVJ7_16885 [Acidimicrobiia bacterium]
MRTTAELRKMRRERGEPGGFGLEEGLSLLAFATLIAGVIMMVIAIGVIAGLAGHAFDGLSHIFEGMFNRVMG